MRLAILILEEISTQNTPAGEAELPEHMVNTIGSALAHYGQKEHFLGSFTMPNEGPEASKSADKTCLEMRSVVQTTFTMCRIYRADLHFAGCPPTFFFPNSIIHDCTHKRTSPGTIFANLDLTSRAPQGCRGSQTGRFT